MTQGLNVDDLIGRTAVDVEGGKIGKIGQIYLDDTTNQPQWVTISTGLFGTKESFAPLQGSRINGDDLQLAVTKSQVKDAPNIDSDGHMDDADNSALFRHYSLQNGTGNQPAERPMPNAEFTPRGEDTSGPNTDGAMTRSEEQLNVGTEQVESGQARLRKYVVTENVTRTVPVSHEEVRIEREPITDANRGEAVSGAEISEEEHAVTLHAERAVVDKETVPVERVTMGTQTVTEDQTISEDVRKEQIEADQSEGRSRR